MLHQFNVTSATGEKDRDGNQLRSEVTVFTAEVDLQPSPQLKVPETISGSIAGTIPELDRQQDVQVGFEGLPYRFDSLQADGAFQLSRIHRLSFHSTCPNGHNREQSLEKTKLRDDLNAGTLKLTCFECVESWTPGPEEQRNIKKRLS